MGQNSSVPVGGRRKSFRNSWRSPFPPRSLSRKGNLSATFNVFDVDTKIDQLNVNIASEEELMTLPGVSRIDAHSIVEYRQRLGRFKIVEDLALVSGIGADKLALIRPEICVGPRRSPSCASSRAQSIDSLPSADKSTPRPPIPPLNINTATVFELQAIPGFTQEIAANVIDYRDKHGNFINLDQLTKVKGINNIRLGAVRSRLTIDSDSKSMPFRNGLPSSFAHSTPKNSPKLSSSHSSQPIANGKISGHKKTMSVPIKFGPSSNGLAIRDILDILSVCSPRPIVEDHFDGKRKGRPAMRIATWNLSGLSFEKADNPGVREVICQTILENRFSLIALQDILSNEALDKICNELNFPTLRRTKEWKENSHNWHFQSSKGLGFLWDASDNIAITSVNVAKSEDSGDIPQVINAMFKVGSLQISVVNILYDESLVSDLRYDISTVIQQFSNDKSNNQIIVGDFSYILHKTEDCSEIFGDDFKGVLPAKVSTNSIPLNHHSTEYSFCDNIYQNKISENQFTNMSGVVRHGLTHLAIPRSWSWGGPASEHCPVWYEIYLDVASS